MNYFLPWIGVSISASAAFITAVTSSVCGLLLCCSATADPVVKILKQIIVSVRFSSRGVPLDFIVVKVIAFSIPPRPHFIIIRVLPITSLQPFHTPTIFCFTGLIKDKIYHAAHLWSNVIINLFTDGSWQYILDRHMCTWMYSISFCHLDLYGGHMVNMISNNRFWNGQISTVPIFV